MILKVGIAYRLDALGVGRIDYGCAYAHRHWLVLHKYCDHVKFSACQLAGCTEEVLTVGEAALAQDMAVVLDQLRCGLAPLPQSALEERRFVFHLDWLQYPRIIILRLVHPRADRPYRHQL